MRNSLGYRIFNQKYLKMVVLLTVLIIMAFATGCDKRSVDQNKIIITNMTASGTTLYEDNGATYITVSATVKDNNGFPVAGQTVNFKSNFEQIGILPARATTDSSGVAKAEIFVSSQVIPVGMDSLVIRVESYLDTRLQKFVDLNVRTSPDVQSVTMDPVPAALSINQEISIKARAFDANNNALSDGTKVTFVATGGYFVDEYASLFEGSFQAPLRNGVATIKFRAGTVASKIRIFAKIGDVVSVTKQFMVLPGNPRLMTLVPVKPGTDTLMQTVPINGQSIEVQANLSDEWGNLIAGRIIDFTTTLGNITPNAATDTMGIAKVMFNPGSIAGNATITATADSAVQSIMISITSDAVQFMRFTNEGTINLNVAGSGGIESQTLSVKLYDTSGNLVTEQKRVRFELKSKPSGTLINNSEGEVDVMSYGGIASVSINSGTESGLAVLRATLMNEDGTESAIYVEQGRIIIHAGAPHTVAFTIGGHDSGVDLGAGNWKVIVSAIIRDRWGNPVDKGTGVYFSIPDSTIDSDSVTIVAPAYVGNLSADGDSAAGTAYTTMIYHGSLSNTVVKVRATINQTFFAESELVLPMQNITIEMIPNPQHIDWSPTEQAGPATKSAQLFVKIIDGQGNLLRNVPLQYHTTLGFFPSIPDTPDDGDGNNFTGTTDMLGMSIKTITFYQYECPPPSPAGPGETSGTITVVVLGTGKSTTTDIILRRYPE